MWPKLRLSQAQTAWMIFMIIITILVSLTALVSKSEPLPLWVPIVLMALGLIGEPLLKAGRKVWAVLAFIPLSLIGEMGLYLALLKQEPVVFITISIVFIGVIISCVYGIFHFPTR
jgi:hypothetical protein